MSSTILRWGNRGGIMLPDLIGVPLRVFLFAFVPFLVGALYALERYTA